MVSIGLLINICVAIWSDYYGLDRDLVHAVIEVESSYNSRAVALPEESYGLMQVRKKYVPETKKQLLKPCNNIRVGTRILHKRSMDCGFRNNYSYVICYNRGVTGAKRVKHPNKDAYYNKILSSIRRRRLNGKKVSRFLR